MPKILEQLLRDGGEPCAVKVASTVLRGDNGTPPLHGGSRILPYVIDLQFRTPANRCGGTQSVHSVFDFPNTGERKL